MANGLHPQESSHRASQIATDLAILLAKQLDMINIFVSRHEMFHIQMQMLYVMIDLMGATSGNEPEFVVEEAKKYFRNLSKEQHAKD